MLKGDKMMLENNTSLSAWKVPMSGEVGRKSERRVVL